MFEGHFLRSQDPPTATGSSNNQLEFYIDIYINIKKSIVRSFYIKIIPVQVHPGKRNILLFLSLK